MSGIIEDVVGFAKEFKKQYKPKKDESIWEAYCKFADSKPKNPISDVLMQYDIERERAIVEPLLKQIEDANRIMKKLSIWKNTYGKELACRYLKKWDVK